MVLLLVSALMAYGHPTISLSEHATGLIKVSSGARGTGIGRPVAPESSTHVVITTAYEGPALLMLFPQVKDIHL